MNYKTKSLIYFSCFVVAATSYYLIEQHDEFQNQLNSQNYVETHFEDTDSYADDSIEDDLEEEIK